MTAEMGKSKKRILHKTNSNLRLTREAAVERVFEILRGANDRADLRGSNDRAEARDLITLFGLTAEELAEAGVCYEDLVSFGNSLG